MKNKGIIIFTVVILVVITGFFLLNSFLKKNIIEPDTAVQEEIVEENIVSLIVPQQAGGASIFIESAFLLDGGYVVIHKDDEGNLGEIIGISEFLRAGANDNFLMDINEEVIEGDILFAMLHTDDGDEVFDPLLDKPTKDRKEDIVLIKFNIVSEGALDNEFKL